MPADGPATSPSFLVIDELFAVGSPQFLPTLLAFHNPAPLAAFAGRWLADGRPWAREQLLAYPDLGTAALNHNPLVKRLFKGVEARGDDELVGAFAVAFDRLVRRVRTKTTRWHPSSRAYVRVEHLVAPQDTLKVRLVPTHSTYDKRLKRWIPRYEPVAAGSRLFSYHTRYYLRRRAWRYFRRAGFRRPADYVPAVSAFLARYADADLSAGEHLLDSWSLLHACFGRSEAIEWTASRPVLKDGASLASLAPAPMFERLWREPAAARHLLALVTAAGAHLVRAWAIDVLRRWHAPALAGLPVDDLIPMLLHADEAVQALGAELLASATNLESVPFDRWFRLLQATSLPVLEAVAAAMRAHVRPASVTLFDAVNLAAARAAPVARLGLHFLQGRPPIGTPHERQAIANLAAARSAAAAGEVTAWALNILGQPGAYDVEQVTRFFDSLLPEVRRAAWAWLTPTSAGWDDPALWSRLTETPHEELRLSIVDVLVRRAKLPGMGPDALAPLWTGVLLNIHRGGRKKLTALRQVADALRRDPASADRLVPVLAVAIRSVRAPEARAGLAAVVASVTTHPAAGAVVARELPELILSPTGAAQP